MRSVELFTGCGGLAIGLSRAGFHHEMMIEWDEDAVATVQHNQARRIRYVREWPITRRDVREVDWRPYADQLDLVAGGPPCQPFSIGGKHQGHIDKRDMWPEAIRAVREALPRAFLFENVRGIARSAFANYLQWIVASLQNPGLHRREGETIDVHMGRLRARQSQRAYDVLVMKVNAADFGAPQKRHRVIVAGIRCDQGVILTPPAATHTRDRLLWDQWITGDYWRRHGLRCPPNKEIASADRALVSRLRRFDAAPKSMPWMTVRDALSGLGEPNGANNHVFQAGARAYLGHTGSLLDQPSKALKAGDHGVPGGENMMVRDDGSVRYFTVREAARLQGLPDTYHFPRSWTESMRQIGNAVPTQLSEYMGKWLASLLLADAEERAVA